MILRLTFIILSSLVLNVEAHAAYNCAAVKDSTVTGFAALINDGKNLSPVLIESIMKLNNPDDRLTELSNYTSLAMYVGIKMLNDCPKFLPAFEAKKLAKAQQEVVDRLKTGLEKDDDLAVSKSEASLAYLKSLKNSVSKDVLANLEQKNTDREKKARESCPKRDFESSLPPVMNQKGWGWCYAIAASTLASFKTKTPVSTTDIVVNFQSDESLKYFNDLFEKNGQPNTTLSTIANSKTEDRLRSGGFTNIALKATMRKGGFCKASDLPDETILDADTAEKFGTALGRLQALMLPSTKNCPPARDAKFAQSCKSRFGNPNWYVRNQTLNSKESNNYGYRHTTLDMARYQLERGNIASITLIASRSDGQIVDLHEVVLAGMDWNEKKKMCEYKVRNSWGKDCGKPMAGSEHWISFNNETCKNGYFTIDAKNLSESVVGVSALEDQ